MSRKATWWPVRPLGVLLTIGQGLTAILALCGVAALIMGAMDGDPMIDQVRRAIALLVVVAMNVACVVIDRRQYQS